MIVFEIARAGTGFVRDRDRPRGSSSSLTFAAMVTCTISSAPNVAIPTALLRIPGAWFPLIVVLSSLRLLTEPPCRRGCLRKAGTTSCQTTLPEIVESVISTRHSVTRYRSRRPGWRPCSRRRRASIQPQPGVVHDVDTAAKELVRRVRHIRVAAGDRDVVDRCSSAALRQVQDAAHPVAVDRRRPSAGAVDRHPGLDDEALRVRLAQLVGPPGRG